MRLPLFRVPDRFRTSSGAAPGADAAGTERPARHWNAASRLLLVSALLLMVAAVVAGRLSGHLPNADRLFPRLWLQTGGERGLLTVGLLTGALTVCWQMRRLTLRQPRESGQERGDKLTGLPDRRALNEQLQALLNRGSRGAPTVHGRGPLAPRGQQVWSVLLIDIDHFRALNDAHGQLAGDEVLKALTACMRQELRADDVLGRWGGEEFLALLPGTGFEGALVAAERLRRAVSLRTFPYAGSVTVSVGVASGLPGDALERVVARADAGVAVAKQSGRNRVAFSE
ncbi:GGDEF domain-containing protein [Deinococcus altitudinis]|uniref:GGDEF domain-containing protein n=1 Tax=Deinococcus altitudinis TaxID=468914 RepID=UPI003891DFBD